MVKMRQFGGGEEGVDKEGIDFYIKMVDVIWGKKWGGGGSQEQRRLLGS